MLAGCSGFGLTRGMVKQCGTWQSCDVCDAVSLCHFEALKPRCRHGGLFCMSVRLKVSTVGAKLMFLFFATAVYEILFKFSFWTSPGAIALPQLVGAVKRRWPDLSIFVCFLLVKSQATEITSCDDRSGLQRICQCLTEKLHTFVRYFLKILMSCCDDPTAFTDWEQSCKSWRSSHIRWKKIIGVGLCWKCMEFCFLGQFCRPARCDTTWGAAFRRPLSARRTRKREMLLNEGDGMATAWRGCADSVLTRET